MATITIQIEDQPNALPLLTIYESQTDEVTAALTIAALAVTAISDLVSHRSSNERLDYPPAPQR
jgi:hypothetical protein